MARAKASAAEECCAKCEKDIAALKKEVAALKAALAKKPAGGADARVDLLIEWIQVYNLPSKLEGPQKRAKILKSLGIK